MINSNWFKISRLTIKIVNNVDYMTGSRKWNGFFIIFLFAYHDYFTNSISLSKAKSQRDSRSARPNMNSESNIVSHYFHKRKETSDLVIINITFSTQARNYGGGPEGLAPCLFPLKDKVPFSACKVRL